MSENLMDAYWQMPPMSRTAATFALGLSVSVHFGLLPGYWVVHVPEFLWKFPPQIWRLVTCFFVTGSGLGLLFDSYFLYHYMSQLEIGHSRFPRKEDLLWYLMFVSGVILCLASTAITVPGNEEDYPCSSDQPIIRKYLGLVCGVGMVGCLMDGSCDPLFARVMIDYVVGFQFMVYLRALILAMTYTVTQDQRGMKANFYFITIPAQLTPYCMILINLLFPGGIPAMILQIEGLIAAHLYGFLTRIWPEFGGGRNIIPTPSWVSMFVKTPRVLERGFGTAIRPGDQASGSSTGASRGPLPDSWRTRGPGHRLG